MVRLIFLLYPSLYRCVCYTSKPCLGPSCQHVQSISINYIQSKETMPMMIHRLKIEPTSWTVDRPSEEPASNYWHLVRVVWVATCGKPRVHTAHGKPSAMLRKLGCPVSQEQSEIVCFSAWFTKYACNFSRERYLPICSLIYGLEW